MSEVILEARAQSVARAPGRCGILGNPSDIYGGKVLSCAIPAHATCRLTKNDVSILPEDLRIWSAVQARYPIDSPVKVDWETEIPRSSGLSGSTALLAATLAAVLEFCGTPADLSSSESRSEFAELARGIERYEAGIMCGFQDAYMISHGGLQLMDFAGKSPDATGPRARLTEIDAPLPFLLITTGVERLSGSVHGPLADRWRKGEKLVRDGMAEIGELAEPGAEWLTRGDYGRLGTAMDRNHALVAEMGGSGDRIDCLIADCKACGAISAKLAGAGMGGTVIALTEDGNGLEQQLRERGYSRFLRPARVPGVELVS